MPREHARTTVNEQTQQLLSGPLKHVRAAALAAALLPLASIAVAPVSAQDCGSGGICGSISGFVFNDTNSNGIRDGVDTPLEGVSVIICQVCDGNDNTATGFTDNTGAFSVLVPIGSYTVIVQIPEGSTPSQTNQGGSELFDSDGMPTGSGFSGVPVTVTDGGASNADFGFAPSPAPNLGTGTPGYWKNHPEAWSVATITIGGVAYSKEQAITWLGKVGKDKTTTMFSSLVSAKLNVNPAVGNENCVAATIAAADAWLATYHLGSGVTGSSAAWKVGEPLHQTLDAYNNGLLCAPHRN